MMEKGELSTMMKRGGEGLLELFIDRKRKFLEVIYSQKRNFLKVIYRWKSKFLGIVPT